MRIGYVIIDCDGRDGSAVAMAHVMHRMADRGHDVHLFADNADGADLNRVTWHRVRALPGPAAARFASFFVNCSRHVRRLRAGAQFDVLQSVGCNTAGANLYQVQNVQSAKRAILEAHGEFPGGGAIRSRARRLFYRFTESAERRVYCATKDSSFGGRGERIHYMPASEGIADELRQRFPLAAADIHVVPNGVDLDRFHPRLRDEARVAIRLQFGIPSDALLLLFLGGEWARKGLRHAIEAIPLIQSPHHAAGAHLLVAGRDTDQPRFEAMARNLGVVGRVHFVGFRADAERMMAAADLFVLPSYYEAFSLASLQAAAAGLPMIAAPTNGTAELIRPAGIAISTIGENGALVDRDGAAIAKMVDQIAAAPDSIRRLGDNARAIVEAEYGWDQIADRAEATYRQIVATAAED